MAWCGALLASCGGGTSVEKDGFLLDAGGDAQMEVAADVLFLIDIIEVIDTVKAIDVAADVPADGMTPQCAPGEGCFLDPCAGNEDCQSGWCVQHLGDGVCSQVCQAECPAGWTCQQVAGTVPDVVYICVSDYANLCRPCSLSADCTSVGGAADACVDYGPDGDYCGGPCVDDADCPWGFSCLTTVTVDSISTLQCVADAGECPCTGKSVAQELWTTCSVTSDAGTCTGKRICTGEGLSDCDAELPVAEACNGLDDDCDGEADEPDLVEGEYLALCDDGNDCTDDACMGVEGCVNEVLEAGECTDGNPCTVADHCDAGICAGEAVECNDDNPCTEDICTEAGGCDHLPAVGECDDLDPCTLGDHCQLGECIHSGTFSCSDGNVCTDDACNPAAGCQFAANDLPCPDGQCSMGLCLSDCEPQCSGKQCGWDGCDGICGVCQGPQDLCIGSSCVCQPDCDGKVCGSDGCDGSCGSCSDGIACTDDLCIEGLCTYPLQDDHCFIDAACVLEGTLNPALNCEVCEPAEAANAWSIADDGADCDDSDACTPTDICAGGDCEGSGVLDCDDNDPGTVDSCFWKVGCIHVPTSVHPRDCEAHLKAGKLDDGIYTIDPDGDGGQSPVQTWCDMAGGGWTLIIHRAKKSDQPGCTVSTTGAVGTISGPDATADAKLADEIINAIKNPYYRFDGNYGDGIRQYWKIEQPWTSLWSGKGINFQCTLNQDNWPGEWWPTQTSSYPLGNTTCLGAGYSTIWWHVGQYSCAYIGDTHGWGWRNWDDTPATMNFWAKSLGPVL